jgi:tetratricopeptide (TPR) repeat protein
VTAQIYNASARVQEKAWGTTQHLALLKLSQALARQYDDRSLQAEVLRHLGEAMYDRDLQAAEPMFEESLRICRELGDGEQEGWTTYGLAEVAGLRGDLSAAERYYKHSLAIFKDLRTTFGQAIVLRQLSMLAERRGDHVAADDYLTRALTFANNPSLSTSVGLLIERGKLACLRGDYQRALDPLRSGYDHAMQMDDGFHGNEALMWQAVCYLELGDLGRAMQLCRQTLMTTIEDQEVISISQIVMIVANVALAGGRHITATRLLGWADSYLASFSYKFEHDMETDWKRLYDRALAACRAILDAEAFEAALAAGQALTLEQAVAEALAGAHDRGPAAESSPGDATR